MIKTSSVIKYLKSNFLDFLKKIKYKNNISIEANRYINRYFERKPIAAKKPTKAQSANLMFSSL